MCRGEGGRGEVEGARGRGGERGMGEGEGEGEGGSERGEGGSAYVARLNLKPVFSHIEEETMEA